MATTNLTNPNTLNSYAVEREYKFSPKQCIDMNWLYNNYMMKGNETYLGVRSFWNQRHIINTPILDQTELNRNILYVNNTEGIIRLSVPYQLGNPFIVEDIETSNPYLGAGGTTFRIKMSEDVFSPSEFITSLQFNSLQLYIAEKEPETGGNGVIYTVQVLGGGEETYYPHELLRPGVQYVKVGNVNGEFDTQKGGVASPNLRMGMMDLRAQIGGGNRSAEYYITGEASMQKIDENKHPELAYLNRMITEDNAITYYITKTNGEIGISWQSTIEKLLMAEMVQSRETSAMWAAGGDVNGGNGRRTVRVGQGIYHQMRYSGNYMQYNTITLEEIESAVANLYANTGIPIQERHTKINTGTVGIKNVSKSIYERMKTVSPGLIESINIPGGFFYGGLMNAGFKMPQFTQYFSPVAGWIEFVYNSALDNVYGLRTEGLIGQYPRFSSSYLIWDVTDSKATNATSKINASVAYRTENGYNQNANIVMIKPIDYGETYWGYIVGTHHPLGAQAMKGMYSANDYNGYRIWMKEWGVPFIIDKSRVMLMEKTYDYYAYENGII